MVNKKRAIKNNFNKFNISNRLSYTLIAIFSFLLIGVGVYASMTAGIAPNPGHTLDNVSAPTGCGSNTYLKWTGDSWICESSSSSFNVNQLPPPIIRRVFVTSTTYYGNLGGANGANQKCQERANAASLGGSWRAIITSNSQSLTDVIGPSEWYRLLNVNGEIISERVFNPYTNYYTPFHTYDSVNYLISPINVNEFGVSYSPGTTVYAWTGGLGNSNCNGWTTEEANTYGTSGLITTIKTETGISGAPNWYTQTVGLGKPCGDSRLRLYCIEA